MAVSIIQIPSTLFNNAQSPLVFSVNESNADVKTSSSFQYIAELYYWTGSNTQSGSTAQYTLEKYPNAAGVGIFDVSRVVSSTFTDLLAENTSSVQYFGIDAYIRYKNNPTGSFITGSHINYADIFGSRIYTQLAVDGYNTFQQTFNASAVGGVTIQTAPNTTTDFYPILTQGPPTQSFIEDNYGRTSIWAHGGGSGTAYPQFVHYIDESAVTGSIRLNNASIASNNTNQMIETIPIGWNESDFPLSGSIRNFRIQPIDNSGNLFGSPIYFNYECTKKYDNIRIKWKNSFGAFDYFNFNLVSRESFNTQRSRYQPQIGSWDKSVLTYEKYESSIQNYISDSTLKLSVNTDYVSEDYNDIFKELMVSDEIYWVYDEANDYVRPLALDTSTFNIKTHVVDKLIQYQFDFTQGQGYKLIF